MFVKKSLHVIVLVLISTSVTKCLRQASVNRRRAFLRDVFSKLTVPIGAAVLLSTPSTVARSNALVEDSPMTAIYNFELRDRKGNKDAIIREDYWYMLGKTPPRRLDGPLKGDDPKWNAFGTCESTAGTGNPCTYVPLSQRIPSYKKYGFAIADGIREYQRLGQILRRIAVDTPVSDPLWQEAAAFLTTEYKSIPPAVIDAELKMILFATAMLISPNFPSTSRELLVARYYVNEAHFAATEMKSAIEARDRSRTIQAWEYGKDSWNSYFQVVNRSIVPKVGEKFLPIA